MRVCCVWCVPLSVSARGTINDQRHLNLGPDPSTVRSVSCGWCLFFCRFTICFKVSFSFSSVCSFPCWTWWTLLLDEWVAFMHGPDWPVSGQFNSFSTPSKKPSVQAEQRHSVSRLECLVVSARFRNFAQAVWSPRGHFPSWPIEFIETIRVAGAEKQKSEIKLDLFYFEEKPVTDLTGLRTCSNPRCCLRTYALLSFFSLSLSLSIVKLNISSCCFSPFRFLIGITASLARSWGRFVTTWTFRKRARALCSA